MDSAAIITATTPEQFAQARRLFELYQEFLGIDLCFQGFRMELETLSTMYGPPRGVLLLAVSEGQYVGCVGLRDLGQGIAEMKRMYVIPSFQGRGIGNALALRFLEIARSLHYSAVRLDTIPALDKAVGLYCKLGFVKIGAYRFNPDPSAIYMEKVLS